MKSIGIFIASALLISMSACAQFNLGKAVNDAKNVANSVTNTNSGNKPLSNAEVVQGLKDALKVGTNNSTAAASKVDGFYKNPKIKIPFPPEAIKMKNTLENLGMKPQVDKFVLTLNRAAEEASKKAAPIFIQAIKGMTIGDGFKILNGSDSAATMYLKNKTTQQLHDQFLPIVKAAIQKVEVTKYWTPLVTKYNKIPFVQKQNPDLNEYVTQRALQGLFKLVAAEELKIRKDPAARVTDILKKVFGSLGSGG